MDSKVLGIHLHKVYSQRLFKRLWLKQNMLLVAVDIEMREVCRETRVQLFKATHIFSAKNIRILYIESAKTVNEMTLNELVKLTTLWTTGPWSFTVCLKPGDLRTNSHG